MDFEKESKSNGKIFLINRLVKLKLFIALKNKDLEESIKCLKISSKICESFNCGLSLQKFFGLCALVGQYDIYYHEITSQFKLNSDILKQINADRAKLIKVVNDSYISYLNGSFTLINLINEENINKASRSQCVNFLINNDPFIYEFDTKNISLNYFEKIKLLKMIKHIKNKLKNLAISGKGNYNFFSSHNAHKNITIDQIISSFEMSSNTAIKTVETLRNKTVTVDAGAHK